MPRWDSDEVLTRFYYADLVRACRDHGFCIDGGAKFNWIYFAWELLPLAFRPLDLLSPIFIGIERLFAPLLSRWGGHCWIQARKPAATQSASTAI